MLIIDYNQIVIANIMRQIGSSNKPVDEDFGRHMILNTIRSYTNRYKRDYGPEVVIACDNTNYWRRDYFPFYKYKRKSTREDSGHDWDSIFNVLDKVRQELMDYSPYKVIHVPKCEADDIIGVLVPRISHREKVLIISSDKDFIQLQKYPNVQQYSPKIKKFIKTDNASYQLKELIIRGDKSDGVPNVLSEDDAFADEEKRQGRITGPKFKALMNQNKDTMDETTRINYIRNETLIDLTKIPQNLVDEIVTAYDNTMPKRKSGEFMNYMIKFKLKELLKVMDEF